MVRGLGLGVQVLAQCPHARKGLVFRALGLRLQESVPWFRT